MKGISELIDWPAEAQRYYEKANKLDAINAAMLAALETVLKHLDEISFFEDRKIILAAIAKAKGEA